MPKTNESKPVDQFEMIRKVMGLEEGNSITSPGSTMLNLPNLENVEIPMRPEGIVEKSPEFREYVRILKAATEKLEKKNLDYLIWFDPMGVRAQA